MAKDKGPKRTEDFVPRVYSRDELLVEVPEVVANTPFKRVKHPPKEFDPFLITEQAGYISPQRQIESLISAGARLLEYRKELYDFNDKDPTSEEIDAFDDPTRDPGYDRVDAANDAEYLSKRAAEKKATALSLAEEAAAKHAAQAESDKTELEFYRSQAKSDALPDASGGPANGSR